MDCAAPIDVCALWACWRDYRRQRRISRAIAALRHYRATVARSRQLPPLDRERQMLRRVYRAWRS